MSEQSVVKWAGVAGLAGIVLVLVGAFLAGAPPDADDPVSEVRAFLVDNRSALLVGTFIGLIAFPFLAWFIVTVRAKLAAADASPLPLLVLVSLLVTAGLGFAGNAVGVAVIYVDGFAETASDDTVQLAWNLQNLLYIAGSIGFATTMASFGVSALRGKTFPAWSAWLAVVTGVLAILGLVGVFDAELGNLAFVPFLGFGVWMIATSIALLTAPEVTPSAEG